MVLTIIISFNKVIGTFGYLSVDSPSCVSPPCRSTSCQQTLTLILFPQVSLLWSIHKFPSENFTRASRSTIYLIFVSIIRHSHECHMYTETQRHGEVPTGPRFLGIQTPKHFRYVDGAFTARSGKSGLFSPKSHQVMMSPLPFEETE